MVSSLDGEKIITKNKYTLEFFNLEDLSIKGKKNYIFLNHALN